MSLRRGTQAQRPLRQRGGQHGGLRRGLLGLLVWIPALGAIALAWYLARDLFAGEEGLQHHRELRSSLETEVAQLQETTRRTQDLQRKGEILRTNPEALEEQVRMRVGAVRDGEVLVLPPLQGEQDTAGDDGPAP